MSPVARAAKLMLNGLIFIILAACTIWCAAFIYLFVVYGPFEAIVFATGSIMLLAIIYGMKRSDDRRRDRRCDRRYDHT